MLYAVYCGAFARKFYLKTGKCIIAPILDILYFQWQIRGVTNFIGCTHTVCRHSCPSVTSAFVDVFIMNYFSNCKLHLHVLIMITKI